MNISCEITSNIYFQSYNVKMKINDNNILYILNFDLNFTNFLELNTFIASVKNNKFCKLNINYNMSLLYNNESRIFSISYYKSEIMFNDINAMILLFENIVKEIVKKENESDKMCVEKCI